MLCCAVLCCALVSVPDSSRWELDLYTRGMGRTARRGPMGSNCRGTRAAPHARPGSTEEARIHSTCPGRRGRARNRMNLTRASCPHESDSRPTVDLSQLLRQCEACVPRPAALRQARLPACTGADRGRIRRIRSRPTSSGADFPQNHGRRLLEATPRALSYCKHGSSSVPVA